MDTQDEMRPRRKAVDFARVNSELEGFDSHDEKYGELTERWCKGEIEWEEIEKYVDGVIQELSVEYK
jgi:hypothetical protein